MVERYTTSGEPSKLTKKNLDRLIKQEKKAIRAYLDAGMYDHAEEEKEHLLELIKLKRLL